MDSAGTEGLFGSVLIYMSAILFSLAFLAAPIYFIAGPTIIQNNERSDLSRIVKQPVLATDNNVQPNPKAEAALKDLVGSGHDPDRAQLHADMRVHRHVVAAPASKNQLTSTLPSAVYPSFAPL